MSELNYEVKIGEWLGTGWTKFLANWKNLFGYAAIYLLVVVGVSLPIGFATGFFGVMLMPVFRDSIGAAAGMSIASYIVGLINLLITVPLNAYFFGGLVTGGLAVVRGKDITLGDMFRAGGEYFVPICLFMAIVGLISIVQLTVGTGVDLGLQWHMTNTGQVSDLGVAPAWTQFAVLGVQIAMGLLIFLFTVTLTFSVFLIVDQRLSALDAMKRSFAVFTSHYFMNVLYVIIIGLISAAGILACCVGLFFTVPLAFTMACVMYDRIFCSAAA